MLKREPESVQLHPMLPSQIDAVKDRALEKKEPGKPENENPEWEKVYSDHVPIYSQIPSEGVPEGLLKIVSWNVLAQDSSNALAKGEATDCSETQAQMERRHKRIANSLKEMVNANNLQLITLQEAGKAGKDSLIAMIQDTLGSDWQVAPDETGSSYTLYNTKYFESAEKENSVKIDKIMGGTSINRLYLKESKGKSVVVCNCHADYSSTPIKHEAAINAVLQNANDQQQIIMAGDFNVTCISSNQEMENIATAATPSKFSVDKRQGINALDACYYSVMRNQEVTSKQAATSQINPVTGRAYTSNELKKPLQNLSDEVKANHVDKMRMGLRIGSQSDNTAAKMNGMAMKDVENFLRNALQLTSIFLLPEGTDRKSVSGLLPNVAYLSKIDNEIYIDIASPTGKLLGKPTPLENINPARLHFPQSGEKEPLEIKMGENIALYEQIQKQKPKWEPGLLYVREATNMRNERGIAIQGPKTLYDYLEEKDPTLEFFTGSSEGGEFYQVLCKNKDIPKLMNHLDDYFKLRLEQCLDKLKDYRETLSSQTDTKSQKRIAALDKIFNDLETQSREEQYKYLGEVLGSNVSASLYPNVDKNVSSLFSRKETTPAHEYLIQYYKELKVLMSQNQKVGKKQQKAVTPPSSTKETTTKAKQNQQIVTPTKPSTQPNVIKSIAQTVSKNIRTTTTDLFKSFIEQAQDIKIKKPTTTIKKAKNKLTSIKESIKSSKFLDTSKKQVQQNVSSSKAKNKPTNSSASDYDFLLKFNVYGSQGSEVSNLISRFTDNTVNPPNYQSTDFKIQSLDVGENKVKLQIWDRGDRDKRFREIESQNVRGAGVIIAIDLTNKDALPDAEIKLKKALRECSETAQILLVGTNSEDVDRKITPADLKEFAKKMSDDHDIVIDVAECNPMNGNGVNEVFQKLANQCMSKIVEEDVVDTPGNPEDNKTSTYNK